MASASAPRDPDAVRYSAMAEAHPVRGVPSPGDLERAIEKLGRGAGLQLHGDGRLARMAETLQRGGLEDEQAQARLASELGVFDAPLRARPLERARDESWVEALVRGLPPRLQAERPSHYGMFVAPGAGRRAMVVLSQRVVRLEPIARSEPDASREVRLRGELLAGLSAPRALVIGPTERRELSAGAGPHFDLRLSLPAEGAYRVELFARDAAGERSVARLRLLRGEVAADQDVQVADDAQRLDTLRRRLFARANRLRAAQGLSPLSEHVALTRVAAAELARAPEAPRDARSLTEDARAEGLDAGLLLTTRLFGGDAELERKLSDSAAATSALENPDVTHMAIALASLGGGECVALVLLSRLPAALDTDLAAAKLLTQINYNRRARGVSPLRPEPVLGEVAAAAALAFFAHPERDKRGTVADATAKLDHESLRFRRVEATMSIVQSPEQAAALEPALGAEVAAVGIGIAQGDRPDTGPRAVAVVLVLGWDR